MRQSALHSNQPAFGHCMTQMSQNKKKKSKVLKGSNYLTYVQVMAHFKQGSHKSMQPAPLQRTFALHTGQYQSERNQTCARPSPWVRHVQNFVVKWL